MIGSQKERAPQKEDTKGFSCLYKCKKFSFIRGVVLLALTKTLRVPLHWNFFSFRIHLFEGGADSQPARVCFEDEWFLSVWNFNCRDFTDYLFQDLEGCIQLCGFLKVFLLYY